MKLSHFVVLLMVIHAPYALSVDCGSDAECLKNELARVLKESGTSLKEKLTGCPSPDVTPPPKHKKSVPRGINLYSANNARYARCLPNEFEYKNQSNGGYFIHDSQSTRALTVEDACSQARSACLTQESPKWMDGDKAIGFDCVKMNHQIGFDEVPMTCDGKPGRVKRIVASCDVKAVAEKNLSKNSMAKPQGGGLKIYSDTNARYARCLPNEFQYKNQSSEDYFIHDNENVRTITAEDACSKAQAACLANENALWVDQSKTQGIAYKCIEINRSFSLDEVPYTCDNKPGRVRRIVATCQVKAVSAKELEKK